VEGKANFAYAGPFNEMVLLGVLAIRLQGLHKTLKWNAEAMEFANISAYDTFRVVLSDDFRVIDGHPHFNTKYVTLNAEEAVRKMIKHDYRSGWSLPERI